MQPRDVQALGQHFGVEPDGRIVQNLNCWLKLCLYTSSILSRRGGIIDIAVEKALCKCYWQLSHTQFLLSCRVRDKLAELHFSQFWAGCLVFLEAVMPQMYFDTEYNNYFVIVPCLCCQFSCYIIIRRGKEAIGFEKLIFLLVWRETRRPIN